MISTTIFATVNCYITYDNCFTDDTYTKPKNAKCLSTLIELTKMAMEEHSFSQADLVDNNTGEILAIIKRD